MQRHATKPAPDVPKWSALLVEAVNKPGLIMEAYSAFHNYSIGNQILALVQCQLRGLEPGPINTFPGWQALGRTVKLGERALILCMTITRKVRDEEAPESDGENGERTFTSFMHKARWFAISQTIGDEFTAPRLPEWEAERALAALDIEQIAFYRAFTYSHHSNAKCITVLPTLGRLSYGTSMQPVQQGKYAGWRAFENGYSFLQVKCLVVHWPLLYWYFIPALIPISGYLIPATGFRLCVIDLWKMRTKTL